VTVALLDANVLYPPGLRDLFLWLAAGGVYRPRWTETIHDEWMRSVLRDRPDLTRTELERTRALMDQVDPQSLVTGYQAHIPTLHLPDADDRHVLAAAIAAKATVIVTFNLSDFPAPALAPFGVQALHPDTFVCSLFDAAPSPFLAAVALHRASLRRPPKTSEEYVATLRQNGLPQIADRLERCLDAL
jgi:predicted nucleic acid-binding protein